MYISRHKEADIAAFIDQDISHRNVLLVEGARQVGKTRLVEHVLSGRKNDVTSINLERDRVLRSLIDECREFREFEDLLMDRFHFDGASNRILFIDEAQESSRLGGFVRFMKESWPRTAVILTGSSLRRLFRGDTRYPTGRVQRLVLSSFSFTEFLTARNQAHLMDELTTDTPRITPVRHAHLNTWMDAYLAEGGLPAVVCAPAEGEEPHTVRTQIIADYEEDFRRIFGEDLAHLAKLCLRSVANHLGNVSKNTSVIPAASGFQSTRISEIFERLEAWHLLLRSDQLSLSPEKSHHYLPKRYLFDTGVARHLREASVPSVSAMQTLDADSRKPLGGILENQTAVELLNQEGLLQGWKRSPAGTEIDFVIKRNDKTYPVECKAALHVGKRHMKGVLDYLRAYDMPVGVIVSFAPYEVFHWPDSRRIINIPAYLLESVPSLIESKTSNSLY